MSNEGQGLTTTSRKKPEVTVSRLGLAGGAAALGLSTGFMNVSGWVAQAETPTQQWLNGSMSAGMELFAASALGWAGYQLSRGRWSRAGAAAIAGAAVVYFNTLATQNFMAVQRDAQTNTIETSAQGVAISDAELARIEREVESIIAQNGGTVPRSLNVIIAAYAHLDPASNPINMGRRDAEMGLRREYDRLQAEALAIRETAAGDSIEANDAVRTVIPEEHLPTFIWVLEGLKAGAFFLLGTSDLGAAFKRAKSPDLRKPETPPAPISPEPSPRKGGGDPRHRQQWAIIRNKQKRSGPKRELHLE
jgi:hypothetical protein